MRKTNIRFFVLCVALLQYYSTLYALSPGKDVKLKQSKVNVNKSTQVYVTFDELLNGKFENLKNKKYPAVITGNVKSVQGLFEKAIQTSEQSKLTIPVNARLMAGLIVEFWLKTGKNHKKTTLLETVSKDGKNGWVLTLSPTKQNSKLKWTVFHPNGTRTVIDSNRGLDDPDKWYRIGLLFGSIPGQGGVKGYRIYIDGYVSGEIPNFLPIQEVTGNLIIKTPPNGSIDDLAITPAGGVIYPDIDTNFRKITNLDFEKKNEGWTGVFDECQIDDVVKHGGKYSLKIETDDTYTREYLSPIFSVEPGATYTISFWAKVDRFDKGYSALGIWIRWYFAPEETCSFGGDLIAHWLNTEKEKTFDWRKFETKVTVPVKKEYRKKIHWARIQVKNYHSITKAWVDDIQIEKNVNAKGE